MSEKPKKTLYHSEMVGRGPTRMKIKTPPQKSKYQDKRDYAVVVIDGHERNYTVENDGCGDFLHANKGKEVFVVAAGSRDEATITFVGKPGSQTPPPQERVNTAPETAPEPPADAGEADYAPEPPKAAPTGQQGGKAPPQNPPPGNAKADALAHCKVLAAQMASCWSVAYLAARHARSQIKGQLGEELTPELFQACVGTICIQLSKEAAHFGLPGRIEMKPNGGAK